MYETERIFLDPLNREDTFDKFYLNWFNDQEVTKYNSHGLFPQNEKEMEEFRNGLNVNNLVLKIVKKLAPPIIITDQSSEWIGNICLQSFDWINRSCEFAVVIGDKKEWGKGYCYEAAAVLFFHAFVKLNIIRIWSGTNENNIGMRKVFDKLGMKHEGTFRKAAYVQGHYTDVVEYGILGPEFDYKKAKGLIK